MTIFDICSLCVGISNKGCGLRGLNKL